MSEQENGNGNGNGNGAKELFNRAVKAGQRTYFIAVREAKTGNKYLNITESKRVDKDKFDKSRMYVFKDHIEDFMNVLQEAAEVVA